MQSRTQAEAARILGVSMRTVRRWMSGASIPKIEYQHDISRLAARDRKRVRRKARRYGIDEIPDVDVLPEPMRRKIAVRDRFGMPTGKIKLSTDWTNYDVKHFERKTISYFLRVLRDQKRTIMIIYTIPKGGRGPVSGQVVSILTKLKMQTVGKTTSVGTGMIRLAGFDDVEIEEMMDKVLHLSAKGRVNKIRYIGVLEADVTRKGYKRKIRR